MTTDTLTPVEVVIGKLQDLGCEPRPCGKAIKARCPAHEDHNPSLSICEGEDGRALVRCHAGCEFHDIVDAIGVEQRDLFDSSKRDSRERTKRSNQLDSRTRYASAREAVEKLKRDLGEPSGMWRYEDDHGFPVSLVLRWDSTTGKQIRPVSLVEGGWVIGAQPDPRVLWNLPDILDGGEVYVSEGEKAAAVGAEMGLRSTTSAGGSQAASKTDWSPLSGKRVVLLPDNDEAGEAYARDVIACLACLDPLPEVRVVRLPGMPPKGDLVDYVEANVDKGLASIVQAIRAQVSETTPEDLEGFVRSRPSTNERTEFSAVPLDQLGPGEPPDWIWEGYLARGYMSLFTGLWKSGKTTLISNLLRDMEHGGPLLSTPTGDPVLVISEEASGHWVRRRDELGLGGGIHLCNHAFQGRPNMDEWAEFIDWMASQVEQVGYPLVIVDTLAAHWPVTDENDASSTTEAMLHLRRVTDAGAAVMLVHHPRKSGGSEGRASRGSGAIPSTVDIIIELDRYNAEDKLDTRRVLTTLGRFEECEPEVVIDLQDDGYHILGSRQDASQDDIANAIQRVLNGAEGPLTADEIQEMIPPPKIGRTKLRGTLNYMAGKGDLHRSGTGFKGQPHRYELPGSQVSKEAC